MAETMKNWVEYNKRSSASLNYHNSFIASFEAVGARAAELYFINLGILHARGETVASFSRTLTIMMDNE